MAFVPGTNVAQVNYMFTLHGQNVQNVLTFRHAGPIDQTAIDALGARLVANWDVEVAAQLSSDITLTGLRIYDLTTETAPVYEYSTGLPTSGGLSAAAMPGSVAFCLSLRTANRGRSGRGRIYVAGLTELGVTGNSIPALNADALRDAYRELLIAPPTDWVWGVSSRQHNGIALTAINFQPIVNVIWTDLTVDSQRRRLR
jgi:hypothetical protein